ncbi:prolyl-tRNA synthetase [Martensiomyces pterosporus]|nr:prolyl-tRNA synthetase [Martensiomyces pterosporus]
MSDISGLVSKLSALGFSDTAFEHAPVDTVEQWADALATVSGLPAEYTLTKTLIFKPKQPKTAPIAPVVVIAKHDTATNATLLGKELKLKDLRFANDDVLTSIFQTQKGSVSPFALAQVPEENAPHVKVVVDEALLADGVSKIAFHPLDSSRTVFVTPATLVSFIESVPGFEPFLRIDFAKLASAAPAPAPAGEKKAKKPAAASAAKAEESVGAAKLGIEVSKEADFPKWYQQVLTRSDMLDYYDVSGCYIVRPLAYFVWQQIQEFFDAGIRNLGVKNCYFPMFVSSRVLEREKEHIEGFAPEVAWVTKAGSTDLAEPLAIRPTSETVMYPYFAKWIRSHRDLPLKINQWCSVVRWEFKNPQPFLRTREFLWQEGHCAHLTKEGAMVEVRDILTLYRRIYEELLAVPVIEGVKSEKEKFAGGVATTTVEGFIPTTGRGIQGGTSHYLGQNFSKMFNVVVEDPEATGADRPKIFVHQTSWGLSTRTIGVMVMVHGDDKGLVLPPRVAETQVIIIPCGITVKHTDEDRRQVADACLDVEARLKKLGIRAESDLRWNYTPGFKYSHWEVRGVPIRLEIGPKDLEKQSVLSVRRDNFAKAPIALGDLETAIPQLLTTIHDDMLARARATLDERVKLVLKWEDFVPTLNSKCLTMIPWCEGEECEDQIKERSSRDSLGDEPEDEKAPSMGAKSLCLPYNQPQNPPIVPGETKCIQCGENAKRYALFGRSY